jgi:hypothetical protein
MEKYEVTYSTLYKWVRIEETWIVEADNEDEARELVDSGEGEYDSGKTTIIAKDKEVSDEHIHTYKI